MAISTLTSLIRKKAHLVIRKTGFSNRVVTLAIAVLCVNVCAGQTIQQLQQIEIKSLNKKLTLIADSTTYDQKWGDVHRVLLSWQADNTGSFKQVNRVVLPINTSPDFKYALLIKHEGDRTFVIVKGVWHMFIYDVKNDTLSDKMRPLFTDGVGHDAQTGHLKNIELSQDGLSLSGYAMDLGDFKYDLTNLLKPVQD